MDLGLRDRVYIVTGASRGLGLATARALVADGARVLLTGRDGAAADAAAQRLGERAHGVAADNADPATAANLVTAATRVFGGLHGVLISVGGPPAGPVAGDDAIADQQWRSAFDSVFLGAVRLARTVAGALDTGGSVAFVLSSSVRQPIPGLGISNGLRPGLAGVAKSMALELGPRGIRVNGLVPGRIATDRVHQLDAARGDPDEVRAAGEATIPLRRYGEPDEFGKVAAFVLSPAAGYLTGAMINVDGGLITTI